MISNPDIDGVLIQWGERLFYPPNRIVRAHTPRLHVLQDRAAWIRSRIEATVRRAPQVMVKVTGGGRGMAAIAAHLRYITKNGRLDIEDDRGVVEHGKASLREIERQWQYGGARIERDGHRREAFNIMLSMPRGTDLLTVQRAAREFARAEFADHRYVMVLHEHQANPHVHLSVRAESKHGQRLNPRKDDLRRWRETFAEKLRELGIEAEASPQITRGGSRRTERLWHRKARDEGRPFGAREGEQAPVKLTRSRRDAAQAWCEIAKALASSDDIEDRRLGQSIVNYARWLPGVRYKPPQQQAQRELPGVERGRGSPSAPRTQPARTQAQRATPEPDRGR
jgi:MobA/VirD2-like, nuclease domain